LWWSVKGNIIKKKVYQNTREVLEQKLGTRVVPENKGKSVGHSTDSWW